MKKLILLFLFISVVSLTSKTQAIPIIYNNGETYNIVENLPSECVIDGRHVNLAVKYDQFGLFWMPV